MRVLLLIPQSEPPQLQGEQWSVGFKEFVSLCLQVHPNPNPNPNPNANPDPDPHPTPNPLPAARRQAAALG